MSRRAALLVLFASLLGQAACEPGSAPETTGDTHQITEDAVTPPDVATTEPGVAEEPTGPVKLESPAEEPAAPGSESALTDTLDIGTISMKSGISDSFTVDVPPDARSLTLVVEGWDGVYYSADSVRGPSGEWLSEPGWIGRNDSTVCWDCPLRLTISEALYALQIPNSPTLDFQPGPYTFRLFAIDSATGQFDTREVNVSAVLKLAGPNSDEGTLDVHFHFTGAGGLHASTAMDNPVFATAVKEMHDKLWQASILAGSTTYDDIDPVYDTIETVGGPGNDLSQLFSLTSDQQGDGIHIYIVDSIYSGDASSTGLILGIAGGIPGPPSIGGKPRSGVAVIANASYLNMLGGILGGVMAHESSHYLGLFHSTESTGQGDPIPDTTTGDESNLMHWTSTGKGDYLTKGQAFVLQRNALPR